jgi:drug/metabolite transporter (DMT)-like permease
MNNKVFIWVLFIVLSFIWGSSFILMKEGLVALNAFQVASIRIISSALILLPLAYHAFKEIPRHKIFIVFLSGVMGSLLPAYLFCIAEQELDSALAGTLNSLTPIFALIIGALFFHNRTSLLKILGILVAFTGSVLLYFFQPVFSPNNGLYVMYIVAATILYGINVNMVQRELKDISSVKAVAAALTMNAVPALVVLYFTGYFSLNLGSPEILASTGYSFILGIFGTAVASILFYRLIKRAGAVFSSMVTYGIPLVANSWGLIYGEQVGLIQLGCLVVILAGVFIANRKPAAAPGPVLANPAGSIDK